MPKWREKVWPTVKKKLINLPLKLGAKTINWYVNVLAVKYFEQRKKVKKMFLYILFVFLYVKFIKMFNIIFFIFSKDRLSRFIFVMFMGLSFILLALFLQSLLLLLISNFFKILPPKSRTEIEWFRRGEASGTLFFFNFSMVSFSIEFWASILLLFCSV